MTLNKLNKLEKYKDILFSTLSELTSLIIAGKNKRKIFEKLLDCCLVVLEAERVYLLELEDDRIRKYSKAKDWPPDEGLRVEEITDSANLRDWMLKEGQGEGPFRKGQELGFDVPFLTSHYLGDLDHSRVIMSAPLVAKKSLFGLLVAIHREDGGMYATEDIKLITVLANQAAIALENALLYQKVEREAITDGLTSVYNYRFLISSLEKEVKRAQRFKQVFSFIMLDVDNLKEYNDRLGHLSGSQALKEIAQILKASCREIDLVSKYGGDEFGIILPQTDLSGAEVVARRVLDAVDRHRFDGKTPGPLTCSAGISCFPQDGNTGRELIASADKALYQAKRSGKNKIVTTRRLAPNVKD